MTDTFRKDLQFYKFSAYGFLKSFRLFDSFFILFLRSRGVSFLEIGTLYAVRETAINLLEIPTGLFADGWGRKKTMLASFLSYIFAFLLLYFSNSYAMLLTAMIFYAFGDACRTGTHKAMIFDYLKVKGWEDHKSEYYGNTRSWSQRGAALSALSAGLIVFITKDYALIFLFSIIPYILDFFLVLSYPSYLDRGLSSDDSATGIHKNLLKESFRAIRNRTILSRISHVSVFAGFYKAVKDYLQPVLRTAAVSLPFLIEKSEEQRSAILIGVIYFIIFLISSAASRQAGAVHKKFKDRGRILFYTLLTGALAGLAGGIFLYMNLPWLTVLFFLLIYLLENIRKPIGVGYLGDSIEPGILATVLSVESQGETLWTAVFALLIGSAADALSLSAGISITSGILILTVFLFMGEKEFIKHNKQE